MQLTKIKLTLTGETPLVMNRYNEEEKLTGGKRIPEEEKVEKKLYLNNASKYCIPAICVQASLIEACRQKSIKNFVKGGMAEARGIFSVTSTDESDSTNCELKNHSDWVVKKDKVNLSKQGSAMIRMRPMFEKWSIGVNVTYNNECISKDQMLEIINTAGFSCGLLDQRPNCKGGMFGRYSVKA